MSKPFGLAASLILGLVLHGMVHPAHAQDPASKAGQSLFPLKKGLKWAYRKTIDVGEPCDKLYTVEVGDLVLFDEVPCFELVMRGADGSLWMTDYMAIQDDYAKNFGVQFKNQMVFHRRPGDKLVKLTDAEPAAWMSKFETRNDDNPKQSSSRHNKVCSQSSDTIVLDAREVEAVVVVSYEGRAPQFKDKRWYARGKGLVKTQHWTEGKLWEEDILASFTGLSPLEIGPVTMNPAEVEKEASVELVEAPAGVVTAFKKSRTIKREARFSAKVGAEEAIEGRLQANLGVVRGDLAMKVKLSVEASVGSTLSDSETREQDVRINGDVLPKAKIIWIDVYRTGTIDVMQEGKSYKVPFEFPIGTKLIVRKP